MKEQETVEFTLQRFTGIIRLDGCCPDTFNQVIEAFANLEANSPNRARIMRVYTRPRPRPCIMRAPAREASIEVCGGDPLVTFGPLAAILRYRQRATFEVLTRDI